MNDTISREQAIEWIYNWRDKNKYYHPLSKNKTIPISEVIDILEGVPSAEKTGKWEHNQNGTFTCSGCGCKHSRSRFCPDCGARMVEE